MIVVAVIKLFLKKLKNIKSQISLIQFIHFQLKWNKKLKCIKEKYNWQWKWDW